MFAVAGVSGRTGAATADALLREGQKVRALVRTEAQGEPWLHRHAEVAVVDLADADSVAAALAGMSGAYLFLPPAPADAADPLAAQAEALKPLVAGVKRSGIKCLVFLSAMGAQHPAGTGPVVALHRAEKALSGIAPSVTFLRAAWPLERWAPLLLPALDTGELPFFGHTHLKFPQVGAHDVGVAAAAALVEHLPGTRFLELAGKANWCAEEVAEVVASLLSAPIKAVERPVASAQQALQAEGLSPATAALQAELYQGLARGLVTFAHPNQLLRGKTPLSESLRTLV